MRPKVSGKAVLFPRNDRSHGLKRTAFQTEDVLTDNTPRPLRRISNGKLFFPSRSEGRCAFAERKRRCRPVDASAAGRRGGDDLCNPAARQEGLPRRGVRGCRGQGAAQAPAPCPSPGGDQARMPGSSRNPASKRKEKG